MEPSCLLKLQDISLVGEADIPDISLVKLETMADESDCEEFCLVRPDCSTLLILAPLAEILG